MNHLSPQIAVLLIILTATYSHAKKVNGSYWNDKSQLVSMRLPLPPAGYSPTIIDLNSDGQPDAIKSIMSDGTPILWLDDDGNMAWTDKEGDMVNDCLLVDVNQDGEYGSYGDLIIDWVDEDGDGQADMQIVITYPEQGTKEGAHYMIVRDLERDNVFNHIDWNKKILECWEHVGLSDFFQDYHGQTLFLKMHSPTYEHKDLRLNWENPFLFYDPDNDGLTEMTIRLCDSARRIKEYELEGFSDPNHTGICDWAAISVDIDNDNGYGNEFDLDFTICFQGGGFNYIDQVHPVKNLRGLPDADQFFLDSRYRQLTELIYADHDSARDLIYKRGKWTRVSFTYDEDDDNGRWERVELYENRDPFNSGWKNGGIDNNKQSDASGDRGEWDEDNSGGGKLYIGNFDGKLHLFGAENGAWRIDQNASYYEGWDRLWMGQEKFPKTFASVVYKDTDNNGFIDYIAYDLDGDKTFESVIDFHDIGVSDTCEVINVSEFGYDDYNELGKRVADGIWKRAQEAVAIARQYGLSTAWYAKWMQPHTDRQKYIEGYWLNFYIFKDLEHYFESSDDSEMVRNARKAYYSGDWSLISKKGIDGFCFMNKKEIDNIKYSASTSWGKEIIDSLKKIVAERRRYPLPVPATEGGHFHDYFCPVHNMELTFRWDTPSAHLCKACGKEYSSSSRLDRAWIYKVHFINRDYLRACMYLYFATG